MRDRGRQKERDRKEGREQESLQWGNGLISSSLVSLNHHSELAGGAGKLTGLRIMYCPQTGVFQMTISNFRSKKESLVT